MRARMASCAVAVLYADARRRLTVIESPPGSRVRVDGVELLNFSSNDYLGFADHPKVKRAAADAVISRATLSMFWISQPARSSNSLSITTEAVARV